MADSHVKDLIEPSVVDSVVPSDILLDHGEKPTGPVARQFKPFEHTSQPVSVNAPQLSPSDAGNQTASPIASVSVDTSASLVVKRPVGMKPHGSKLKRRGRPRKVRPASGPTPAPTPVESVTLEVPLENPDVGGGNTAVDLEEHTSTQNPDVLEEPRAATQADDVVELILKKDRDSEAADLNKSTSTHIPEVISEPEIVNTAAEVMHEPVVVLHTPDVLEEPRAASQADKSVEPILKKDGDSEEHEIDEELLRRFQELERETYKKAQLFGKVSEFNQPDVDLPLSSAGTPSQRRSSRVRTLTRKAKESTYKVFKKTKPYYKDKHSKDLWRNSPRGKKKRYMKKYPEKSSEDRDHRESKTDGKWSFGDSGVDVEKRVRLSRMEFNSIMINYKRMISSIRDENSDDAITLSEVTIPVGQNQLKRLDFPFRDRWLDAQKNELDSLKENETFADLEDDEKNPKNVLRTKWVYTVKSNQGLVEKFKARLVACGYSQVEGLDYDFVYAPTLSIQILRSILAISAEQKMHIHQLDFKTAFLNSPVDKTLFVRVEGEVKRLAKSLYGLKQSPRQWYLLLKETLSDLSFEPIDTDANTFYRGTGINRVIVVVYVDDLLVISRNLEAVAEVKKLLLTKYTGTDFGNVKKFIGLNVDYDRDMGVLKFHALESTNKFLLEYGCQDIRSRSYPMIKDWTDISSDNEQNRLLPANLKHRYMVLIGNLRYLATMVRFDICYALRRLSHCLAAPTFHHQRALAHLMAYVSQTRDMGIVYRRGGGDLVAYADASFRPSYEDCVGVAGFVVLLNGGPIVWESKRIKVRAQSTKEVELVALSACAREVDYLRMYLCELNVKIAYTTTIFEDNQPLIKNFEKGADVSNNLMKHKFNQILSGIESKDWKISFVRSKDQLADVLTKPLVKDTYRDALTRVNLMGSGSNWDVEVDESVVSDNSSVAGDYQMEEC